jgi:hypothetical protein
MTHSNFFGKGILWISLNTLVAQVIAVALKVSKTYAPEYRSNEVNKKINKTIENFNRFFLALINFLMISFFCGPKIFEHYSLIVFMIFHVPPIYWISQRVSKYIHSSAIHESLYEFY